MFFPGVVFTNVLLADEINRTPPRTQAALLEAMQERQVTVEGKAHKLPDPFLVIATQNPYEHRDVFELPESQLDRFLFKIVLEYADAESEFEMLDLPHKGIAPDMLGEVRPLLGVVGLDKARDELDATDLPEEVGRYMVAMARKSRDIPGVELGVSSRGVIHLASAARANARLNGRDEVTVAGRARDRALRPPAPAHPRGGRERGRRAPDRARAGACTAAHLLASVAQGSAEAAPARSGLGTRSVSGRLPPRARAV